MNHLRNLMLAITVCLLASCGVNGNKIPGTPGYIEPNSNDIRPEPPTDIEVFIMSQDRGIVTWQDNSIVETGFEVERAVIYNGSRSGFASVAVTPTNGDSYTDTDLMPNRTYIYRVRAFNDAGTSAFSLEASGHVDPTLTLSAAQ